MRELKFRAWNNDIKVMDYGNGELCGYNEFDLSPTATVNDIINQNYPELEWMQYTGIKDKNGKEIYEGDILYGGEDYYKMYGNVVVGIGDCYTYDEENELTITCYGVYIKLKDGSKVNMTQEEMNLFEVIENIYENQELLD